MAQPLRKIATRTKRINIRKYLYFNDNITNDFRYIIYIKLSIKAIGKIFSLDKILCYVSYKNFVVSVRVSLDELVKSLILLSV